MQILNQLGEIVWGLPMILILILVGFYLSLKTNFAQIMHLGHILKSTIFKIGKRDNKEGISPFKAMATALAGSAGTGNIVGVATAIALGGPGAIFWMWVSGFLGMMTKTAEVTLALKFREKSPGGVYKGGPMYYIKNGLGRKFMPLAIVFSIAAMGASLGVGNVTQINSLSVGLNDSFNIPLLLSGITAAIITALVIFKGIKSIANFAGTLVPFMSIFYVLGALVVIFINRENLLSAFLSIFSGAFGLAEIGGGIAGFTFSRAVRFGISRGVFTNEAGMGSSPIAHSAAKCDNPVKQGMWGALEVFIDTIVVCTITALVILSSGVLADSSIEGYALTSAAFEQALGVYGSYFIAIALTLFGIATIIGWSHYGSVACDFLTKDNKTAQNLYKSAYVIMIIIGAIMPVTAVWSLADILNGFMALPNLIALALLSPIACKLINEYFKHERYLLSKSQR